MQADTIVPNVMDPQSWNRYAYTLNNPVRYTDPTGHMVKDEDGGGGGSGDGNGDGGGEPIGVTPETANQYYHPPVDTGEPQYPNGKACWPRCNRDDEYEAQTQTASQNFQQAHGKTTTANGKPPGNAFPPRGGDPDNECFDATGPDCAGGISPPRNPPTTGNGCSIIGWLFGLCGGRAKSQAPNPNPIMQSRGSTGRSTPNSLEEQLALEQAKSNPQAGMILEKVPMTDPRWSASEGWVKKSQNINDIEIHYNLNTRTGQTDDWKFK